VYRAGNVPKSEVSATTRKKSVPPNSRARSRRIVHILLLLFAGVIMLDAMVGDRGLLATLRARREYNELAATIARERAENARLAEQARRLREDPATIEEVARRELGLIRPGEKLFIVKDVGPAKH
jgi:cell division protein FtsB